MNKKVKIAVLVLVVFFIIGAITAYLLLNKPQRDVAKEKGIELTASQLVKEYQANEDSANAINLNKTLEVSGLVTEIKNNQEGKQTIMLASEDAFTGVFCTLKENVDGLTEGSNITIKGICSGMLSDVRLRDAVVVKKNK